MKPSTERWEPVSGYEGLYEVSDIGQVARVSNGKRELLKQRIDRKGYSRVNLSKEGSLRTYRVHRLVAERFIANPCNYSEVNHIDENKLNNKVANLEWCSRSYNVNHGTRIERQKTKVSKPVIGVCGEVTLFFKSTVEAAKALGLKSHSSIGECCRGTRKRAKNFVWRYADE